LVNASDALTHYKHNADRKSRARKFKPIVPKRKEISFTSLPIVNIPDVNQFDFAFYRKFVVVHRPITDADDVVVYFSDEYGSKQEAKGRYVDVDDCTIDHSATSFPCKVTLERSHYYTSHRPFTGFDRGYHFVLDANALSQYLVSIVEICYGMMSPYEVAFRYPRIAPLTYYFEGGRARKLARLHTENRRKIMTINTSKTFSSAMSTLWEHYDLVNNDRNLELIVVTENTEEVKKTLARDIPVLDIGAATISIPIRFARHFVATSFDHTKLKVENGVEGYVFVVSSYDVLQKCLLKIVDYVVDEDHIPEDVTVFRYEKSGDRLDYHKVTV
jgi:hypothetical protein